MRKAIFNAKKNTMEYVELTPAEISAMKAETTKAALQERSRPLTESEITRMLISAQINSIPADDNTALRMLEFYPEWTPGTAYPVGHKVRYSGKLWRVIQAHAAQAGWEPSTDTASLWEQICETHDGTETDPIPYEGNMVLEAGKYYRQDYDIYLCIRDTGNPVYNPLAELVNLYVEVV